jgi:DNA topoisomerase-3
MNDVANNLQIEARSSQMLLIWTDCDREGEHIGSEIVAVCKKSNSNIRVLRAKFSSVSERDVKNAIKFSNLVPLDFLQAKAVEARIELDLRIGAAFTRFQTLSLRDFLMYSLFFIKF